MKRFISDDGEYVIENINPSLDDHKTSIQTLEKDNLIQKYFGIYNYHIYFESLFYNFDLDILDRKIHILLFNQNYISNLGVDIINRYIFNTIKYNFFGIKNKQPIWAEEFKSQLSKSKMALNLSQGKPLKFYSSDRIAQLMGNGILTFIDIKTQLNKFFNKDEAVFYKNHKDLYNTILFYRNNFKLIKKIGKNGKKKYFDKMSSKSVAFYIVNKTLNIQNKKKLFWENK